MDRLQSMQIFARVVEMHSFTRAADSLFLPKSRVTRAVKDLEKFLGTRANKVRVISLREG